MPWMGTVVFDGEVNKYYNAIDLTREHENIKYIQEQLAANGVYIALTYPTKSWVRTEYPTVTAINRTRKNILDIYNGFYKPPGAPDIAENPARKQIFSYAEANKLELSLQLIYDTLKSLLESYKYCGTFSCGEEGLL
ncbi:hypothetical protein [Cohnella abietis]|uniref:Uncharacterized protein n=1 Tax=Cohnella abietis TaxID=2507935 RepID=A0A3T1D2N7_9BACL|nr:hypothetical protein [Cohnella abietis]BBI32373.1 hypothetical protein KCTCHS21_17720 [Cohnella abietis]